ncbi:FAD-dependent monooxygenase [Ancylobacter defluvii]|uniref:3-(3-hydroxyphenyl)propionate hydroxylase n=1 Tax=Ancylobacter defluvii TaxID=1282440 RepID=A0A9W6NCN0_9HYPH|nr:FAD-dependent monooxygenase [Ancylobacter defluvii]MBS7586678.1 FAD-dependent monooxygenase [Ancylobacter defluvii]GLK85978.1 3-(3-hydroxyphenyl)propionate hydroxylase [Ancylobacter defluvii]
MPHMRQDVLIAGAGPVGLTLAIVLMRRGVRVRLIDKRAEPSPYCRAIGVTPRTLEVMDDLGLAADLIDAGVWLDGLRTLVHGYPVRDTENDLSDLPYAQLGVPQYTTERLLADHLAAGGVVVERGVELAGLAQDAEGVEVAFADGSSARFAYVVGCDGAHSAVRRGLGIAFEGEAWPMEFMLGDVRIDWDLPRGRALFAVRPIPEAPPDLFVAIPLPERGRYRVSMIAPERLWSPGQGAGGGIEHGILADRPGATLADLQEVANRLLPDPTRLSDLRWSSLFRISMRLAERYGEGRVFIAGDACHIHPPTGGQGMNTGIQDAYNLGWKLAAVLRGEAAPGLLASYEAERRPVAEAVIARTVEQSMSFGKPRAPEDRLADTQMLVNYRGGPLSAGAAPGSSPDLVRPGDRLPDVQGLRRHGLGFPLRLAEVVRGPDFVLLAPVRRGEVSALETLAERLRAGVRLPLRVVAVAPADAPLEPPAGVTLVHDAAGRFAAAFGDAPGALLVRPDKYVGWMGAAGDAEGMLDYLTRVVGLPAR